MAVLYLYYKLEFLQTHDLNFKYLKTVKDCAPNTYVYSFNVYTLTPRLEQHFHCYQPQF
jgi:hypothetical protein